MNNYLEDILFVAPIAAIFAAGIGLYYINKSDEPETSASSITSVYKHPTLSGNTAAFAPDATKYQNYTMSEPFAAQAPFEFTPAAWLQMMNNMMNNTQMTQMMHQMAAMPTQMMAPTMWVNPHAMLPNGVAAQTQQPMDPKEYKKWYEQQLELQQSGR
ncbi:MAG: hypothetical protein GKR92_03185 [Gammaproteobacteria bacterium]|nr:MAG: hypothetical protein GKR92_03185 [Gammaproteobacteria bacterium]